MKSVSISESTENGKITLTVDGNKTTVPIHGLGSAAYTNSSAYSPAGHTHTKAQVGLGNVDNTADANKSVKHAITADSATTAGTATNVSATQGTDDAARHVWFSDSATETKRAYSDKFKYNPVTNNLTVNVTGNAATASSVAWGNVTGKPSTYAPSAHNHDDSTITSLNASKLFGTIDIARLPHGALERCVIVADDTARFALTTAKIQLGDTVKVNKTQKMYFVIDDSKLNSEAGYTVYTAGSATSVPWSGVTGKPTTFTPSSHTHPYLSALSVSGKTITYTKGDGTTGTITTQDTWRGIQNNLTSTSTTDSLSAAQGKILKGLVDGKLSLSGGTMTGALNFANGIWNVVGDDVAIGDMNVSGTLGVMGKNGNTGIKLVQYGASTTGGAAAPGVTWTCTGNGTSTMSGTLSGTFSGNLSGTASRATLLAPAYSSSTLTTTTSTWRNGVTEGNVVWGQSWVDRSLSGDSGDLTIWIKKVNDKITTANMTIDGTITAASGFIGSLSGNASSATALTTSAGSATQPVYFTGGKPSACTYTLGKSVPSNAVFTDTNTKVTQTAIKSSDYTNWRTIPWGSSNNASEGFTPTTVTDVMYSDPNLTYQPSTGTLRARTFKGNLSGTVYGTSYEANLAWGGHNFAGSYGPIDAAMIPSLGANRLAFIPPESVTVTYSRDGGSTWTDYGASSDTKRGLFSTGGTFTIGKADSTNKATANSTKYQLRITIDTDRASVYTILNKFAIYVSTNGSNSCWCSIDASLESTPTTWVNFAKQISVSGWSGWNIINTSGLTTYGNNKTAQYGLVRFTFGANGGNTSYTGLQVVQILGFGGFGWTVPSNMARTGHLYSYDIWQNAFFPAQVNANNMLMNTCVTCSNWNDAVKTGWYMASGASNAPTSGAWYFGMVIAHNSNYVIQELYQFTASTDAKAIPKFIRAKNNGTWGSWTDVTVQTRVPSNAKFTDTNTWRPLGTTGDTACAGNDSRLSNARPASDVYAWAKASSKPSYSWGEITGKPSTFTPASHSHNYAGSSSAGGNANAAVKLATARKIGNASFDGTANITLSQMGLNVPVEITKADYLAKKKAGTLNANTYYNVIDEYDSANVINDSSVTANSAFSSTKSEKTYAKKSTLVTTTLTASKWTGSSAPYTYVLPVSGATTSNIVEINYASNASSQAIEAYQNAMLADGGQTTNQITIKATEKPTVDIPITIVIRNDL